MRHVKRIAAIPLLAAALFLLAAEPATAVRPAHFDYPTKLLNVETAYVLGPGGYLQIGLGESGLGFRDRFQVTTNTTLDVLSLLNINAKVALLVEDGNLPQIAVGGGYYNLVASSFYVERFAKEALSTEDDLALDAGLSSFYVFASISKKLNERIRGHISYQYRYISGHFESDEPITLTSGDEELSVYAKLDQNESQQCIMAAFDADAADRLKLLIEVGYDASYEKARGGFGLRIGATEHFAIQGGILFPGIDLGDDFSLPVLPNFGFFWRF